MSIAYTVSQEIQKNTAPILCILETATTCEQLYRELSFLLQGLQKNIVYLSDYEIGLNEPLSPATSIVSNRLKTLQQLLKKQVDVLIVTQNTAVTKLPPQSFINAHLFQFKVGDTINRELFVQNLIYCGYTQTDKVESQQTFAKRGSIIDIFPSYSRHPIRIELDDDTIDSIQYFNQHNQRSLTESLATLDITPPYEFSFDQVNLKNCPAHIQMQLKKQHAPSGWHQYLPLLHDSLASLFDYLPNARIYHTDSVNLLDAKKTLQPLFPEYLLSERTIEQLDCTKLLDAKTQIQINLSLKKELKQTIHQLQKKKNILFVCQSLFRMHQLENQLLGHGIPFQSVAHFYEFASKNIPLAICQGSLPHVIDLNKYIIIPEQNTTEQVIVNSEPAMPTLLLDQLHINDLVVHTNHGVGRFIGIETRSINNMDQDFVVIQYANDDKILLPPDELNKIYPYHGSEGEVDALRSKRWTTRKRKAIENIEHFSSQLLRLQSVRKDMQVSPIPLPEEYPEFVSQFPFTETPDQLNIMEHIIHDFQQTTLFNRLICGDVGFGKTEIAMRSAFIALMNGYQVALITPTTVLATQHYNNLSARFEKWNVSMALLSRSSSNALQQKAIANGDIQLIIGTHKLLSQSFSNLGLVIIDEEHRFGVKQKDSVDSFNQAHKLSLTATPIPRSLNMALSKLRQISIMSHPPKLRLPISTFVEEEDPQLVKAALEREIHRGGQAYIIYNSVKDIHQFCEKISKLCPHFTFGIVHGQMPVSTVEKQMARFHSQGFQILIASTIIESGVDIPNANTMIVYRADKLGLAQLHQIRGRVGRSHHQAYAYLLTPPKTTKKASLRLQAIAQNTKLGAGFHLSVADLEIRGAGNLLGEEQSGHVNAVGLSYYTHLLNQATGDTPKEQTSINIDIPKIIPQSYIPDTESRYQFYHRLANCYTLSTLEDISTELIDRYGKIPQATQNLIDLTKLRIQATHLSLIDISLKQKHLVIDVGEKTTLDPSHIMQLIQSYPEYQLGGPHHIRIYPFDHAVQATAILLNRLKN